MSDSEWVDNLKVGDEVAISSSHYATTPLRISTVTKVTKLKLYAGGLTFSKKSRTVPDSGYNVTHLLQPTEAVKIQIMDYENRNAISQILRYLSTAKVSNSKIASLKEKLEEVVDWIKSDVA